MRSCSGQVATVGEEIAQKSGCLLLEHSPDDLRT